MSWIFTFGGGHQLPDGDSLAYRYVRIDGSWHEARATMVYHFGTAWSGQYPDDEHDRAGIARFGLSELPREQWPRVAVAPQTLVWIAVRRRGVEAHRPDGATSTVCGRSMRAGERLLAGEAKAGYAAAWCPRCWPS